RADKLSNAARISRHHPGGMADNSPTFQRWDHDPREPSPGGTAETEFPQPSLRDSSSQTSNPTLKRWAIIVCPSGTDTACALSIPSGIGQAVRAPAATGLQPLRQIYRRGGEDDVGGVVIEMSSARFVVKNEPILKLAGDV